MDRGIEGAAVHRIGVAVIIIVAVDAVGFAVAVIVCEAIHEAAIAVTIDVIAKLQGVGIDRPVDGSAIHHIRELVTVLIAIAQIAYAIAIEVGLARIDELRTVVSAIGNSVVVIIRITCVT